MSSSARTRSASVISGSPLGAPFEAGGLAEVEGELDTDSAHPLPAIRCPRSLPGAGDRGSPRGAPLFRRPARPEARRNRARAGRGQLATSSSRSRRVTRSRRPAPRRADAVDAVEGAGLHQPLDHRAGDLGALPEVGQRGVRRTLAGRHDPAHLAVVDAARPPPGRAGCPSRGPSRRPGRSHGSAARVIPPGAGTCRSATWSGGTASCRPASPRRTPPRWR